jgi:hypothetical protein
MKRSRVYLTERSKDHASGIREPIKRFISAVLRFAAYVVQKRAGRQENAPGARRVCVSNAFASE